MANDTQTLTRSDITEKLSTSLGLSRQQSNGVLEAALEEVAIGLQKEGMVKISSFGTFCISRPNATLRSTVKCGNRA